MEELHGQGVDNLKYQAYTLPTMKHSLSYTYILLVLSMMLWGGTWVAGRVLAQSVHPMTAVVLRFGLASLILLFMCWRADGRLPRLKRDQILPVTFLGATGVFAYSHFFFTGLQSIPAGRAALIVACTPVCIAAISALFYGEKFGPLRIAGAILSLVGVSIVIADGDPIALLAGGVSRGDFMILGCVASWTAYTLGGRSVMKRLPPLTSVAWSSFTGTLMLLPFALFQGLAEDLVRLRPVDWGCVVFLGFLATALAYYWYYRAINVIGASRAGIFINMVPAFAVITGFLLLDEPIHLSLAVGGCMILSGVYLTNRS
jgi:drug/metabolite transporter (DMT)-like permease